MSINAKGAQRPFPIPVVTIGPGSQPEEGGRLNYLPMPSDMSTFEPVSLPEPEALAGHDAARRALASVLQCLEALPAGSPETRQVDLSALASGDRVLVNQILGEGEVGAQVQSRPGQARSLHIQESVFAGVWRVLTLEGGRVVADHVEVGAAPQALQAAALEDVWPAMPAWEGDLPPGVGSAPMLLTEIEDRSSRWRPGQAPHVVNLSLLPVTPEDIAFLDHQLGTGRVLILSRGYGNCRITNACRPHVWRLVYYNSQDIVIQNLVEVACLPDVAQAAPEDLADSHLRLKEVLEWMATA